jgi:soluble lytic murein transglycosylase
LGDQSSSLASFQQAASIEPTEYYSLRAQDQIFNRAPFTLKTPYDLDIDLEAERLIADSWMRVTFNLPVDTDLSSPGALFSDRRFIRGTELWSLDLYDEAKIEFEDLYQSVSENAPDAYRLGNYLVDLGLNRTAIFSLRQVLNLAGLTEQTDTLSAPRYFNLVRYGLYYRELIEQYSIESNFDQLFLYSVMRQESLFDPFAGSGQGALGLMQITPPTGQYIVDRLGWPPAYTTDDLFRPMISIGLGSLHLQDLQLSFAGEIYPALAAYNAGPTAASIWRTLSGPDPDLFLEIIRYPETSDYIRSIFTIFRMYNHIYSQTP